VRLLSGVTGLSNEIGIKPSASTTVVKSNIEAALKRGAVTDAKSVFVDVEDGVVVLTGTVNSWAERRLATSSAWRSPGVRNVIDKMSLVY
jgi:osmotically-inducible protein OsmY